MGLISSVYGVFIAALVFYIIGYFIKSVLLKKIGILLLLFGIVLWIALMMGMIKLT